MPHQARWREEGRRRLKGHDLKIVVVRCERRHGVIDEGETRRQEHAAIERLDARSRGGRPPARRAAAPGVQVAFEQTGQSVQHCTAPSIEVAVYVEMMIRDVPGRSTGDV